ncbi:hypothetical protein MRB53_041308 [Persea americana]|nr:hypothetical protein MRB53_041308 [Persea americana]
MDASDSDFSHVADGMAREGAEPSSKKARFSARQHQPEEYHSSAIVHLENFLGSTPATEGIAGGLEELQAVVLLAGLALLRPVAPGLWYIIGVAVRLSIDLGLYFEDINIELDNRPTHPNSDHPASVSLGKKQWTRDLRRRLWWLVSSCVGRPVSINEAVITTELPSVLDDKYITPSGFLRSPGESETPSYKLVSRHYIRLRLLQSEILQVLQHKQADQARSMGAHQTHGYMNRDLANPFLRDFDSFREWRADLDRRLWEWKEAAPNSLQTGVAFNPLFLELNYWQAIIMLYRQSLSVPEPLASELGPAVGDDVHSPGAVNQEIEEDKQFVFLKVAQAGQTVLKIYRQLHREKLVNYTFLATHHLFMSGISFLYAIWHSPLVRSLLTIDDVDFTVLAATSVLNDLIVKCPPAEACKDAFHRMSQATISMVVKTTGFGNTSSLSTQRLHHHDGYFNNQARVSSPRLTKEEQRPDYLSGQPTPARRREYPKFDMNLRDLFSAEEIENRTITNAPRRPIQLTHPRAKRTTSTDKRARANTASRNPDAKDPSSPSSPNHPLSSTETPHSMNLDAASVHSVPSSQFSPLQQRPRLSSVSYQTAASQHVYQPFVETISQDQPDFIFEHLDFLNDLPVVDPNGFWGHNHSISMDEASFLEQPSNQPSDAAPRNTGLAFGADGPADSGNPHDAGAAAAIFLFDSHDASGFEGSGAWANSELMNTYWFGANGNGNGF